jgi:hypothetical protein
MSRKVQARSEFLWFGDWMDEYGIKLDFSTASRAYDKMVEHFNPTVVRSDNDVIADAFDRIRGELDKLEEGMSVSVDDAMAYGELDPSIRSDRYKVRSFLNEVGVLEHKSPTEERWVKRLTDGSKTDTKTAEDVYEAAEKADEAAE